MKKLGEASKINSLLQDVKLGLRLLRASPAFTATAVLAVTLGIGVNVAVFTVVDTVLLKPLSVPEPERLVFATHNHSPAESVITISAPVHFMHWRAQTDVLEDTAALRNLSYDFTGGDTPYPVMVGTVSEAYFRLLRAPFIEGRSFSAEEDMPSAGRAVVISYDFWTRRLGGAPDIVGRTISLNGSAYTVLGITGQEFDVRDFGGPELWVPLQLDPNTTSEGRYLQLLARLRPDITLEQAQERLAASMTEFLERYPSDAVDHGTFSVLPAQEVIASSARPMLLMLTGAVALVLLLACANVANLLLIRATLRQREIAIRSALGAGRWRVVRQLLTESVMLGLTGGALGLLAGFLGIRWLLSTDTAVLPRLADASGLLGLDWRVAGFTLGLSIATGLLFGLVPAFAGSRTDLNTVLGHSSGRSTGGVRQINTRSLLVTVEIGLAVVLIIGAGLLIRTSLAIGTVDLGLSIENVLTTRTSLSDSRFGETSSVLLTSENALERIRAIPGVVSAASSWGLPLENSLYLPFNIIGRQNTGQFPFTGGAIIVPASDEYFETLGISLLRGRFHNEMDDSGSAPVIVINQAMADLYWSDGRDPFQEQVQLGGGVVPEAANEPPRQIVGVVGNVRHHGIHSPPEPTLYLPLAQVSDGLNALITENARMDWIVKTRAESGNVSAAVRAALRQETGEPLSDVRSLQEIWSLSIARQRISTWLMNVFGASALLLAAIGIYGVVAYSAEHRRHEIGIRMALGAQSTSIRRTIVWNGMRLALIGVAAGLIGAYFLAKVLASILFQVEPHDIAVFVTVPVLLLAVALLAVSIPAVRTSRLDPTEALRYA